MNFEERTKKKKKALTHLAIDRSVSALLLGRGVDVWVEGSGLSFIENPLQVVQIGDLLNVDSHNRAVFPGNPHLNIDIVAKVRLVPSPFGAVLSVGSDVALKSSIGRNIQGEKNQKVLGNRA
jgi:hypothetical protein